ncbi:putative secreted esterase [Legionella geestiana]|uniref:Putative secreted esterase n=1 Tax=Legionella geestiana TaxID=45065 RepID=A0A0W0U9S6_9GAMM|nr:serine hydrolase domain-containing protein [Legionella geestiana]KTD04413.1 putative secreted esterase [Legionella geestiana]STX54565.1 putative secreted esterase [Legionella geestiana]
MAASNSEMEGLTSGDSLPAKWAADDPKRRDRVRATMEAAGITAVSIATAAGGKVSSHGEFPDSAIGESVAVNKNTVFGAASLSKPVFSYLVLKLIEANAVNTAKKGTRKFTLPEGLDHFDLDTPLSNILPLSELNIKGVPKFDTTDEAAVAAANNLTARMVLSHQTGLEHGACQFQFEPGKGHGYSNAGLLYLQAVIDKLTQSNLEALAIKNVFTPLHMNHSSFICDKNNPQETWDAMSVNSLHTTASDYTLFVNAWMHDAALQHAFVPQVFMTEDKGKAGRIGAAKGHIPASDLEHVAWGLGWGLQTDDDGKVTTAYHSGDMNEWRAWVAMNLTDKTATVFFANSHNGHVLAEQIIPETIPMQHANNYFFPKWGFASRVEDLRPDWRENPSWGIARPEAFISGHTPQADPVQPIPAQTVSPGTTQQYRERANEIRQSSPSHEPQKLVEEETESRPLFDPTKITPKSPTDI